MTSYNRVTSLLLCATLAAFVACSDGSREDARSAADALKSDEGLLSYIPADSPYVAAAATPLPQDVRDELEAKSRDVVAAYGRMLRVALASGEEQATETGEDDEPMAAIAEDPRVAALVDEVVTLMTPEGMESAGVDRRTRMALYGYELWPVLRIGLSDEEKMEATLSRFEKKLGQELPTASVAGHAYRYAANAGGENLRLVVAVLDSYLVAALLPDDPPDDLLKAALGIDRPAENIAGVGVLARIAEEYGYTPYGLGFLDFERVADEILDDQSGINREILASAGFDAAGISKVCRDELQSLVAIAPRMVTGYTEISANRFRSNSVIELRPDIAEGLSTITAPVPGLGQAGQAALLSFGMSFNLQAVRDFYAKRLDALEADPYACEWFADLQDGVAKGRELLSQPLPPVAYSFRGFLAAIDRIDGMDIEAGQPPTDIDARLLVATDNAEALVAMAAMFSPEIAALELKPDAQPVSVPIPPMASQIQAAHVAMSENALALSIGEGNGERLPDMLAASASTPAPFMSTDMDGSAYYGFIADVAGRQGADNRSPEFQQAFRETMVSLQNFIGRISVDVHFTERGIEIPSTVELAE